MLTVSVNLSPEQYDEEKNEFVSETFKLRLEHSLVSLSKWESKFCKPFVGKDKTTEETLRYSEAMILNPKVPEGILEKLCKENVDAINEYISAPMTATTVREAPNQRPSRRIVTSELIYSWMISLNIPVEFQHWHLSRLLMLIRVCNAENTPPQKKKGKAESMRSRQELNAQRRAAYGTRG
jgi:hypothetical protein